LFVSGALFARPAEAGEPNAYSGPPDASAYTRSDVLAWTSIGVGVLHHVDHVLRGNHSGFPFTAQVTVFTPTLLLYPLALGGLYFDAGPLYWVVFDSAALIGVVGVHLALEPPGHVYHPWVDRSNLLGVRAPVLGGVALGILSGLTVSLGSHLVSCIIDGTSYGFTWKRKPQGAPREARDFTLSLGPEGASAAWLF
jgi:hypothetical protein